MPVLTRAWQLLLKGLREVKDSPRPLAAADMVLVRIGFAADLPTPDEALRKLEPGGERRGAARTAARRRSQRAWACGRPQRPARALAQAPRQEATAPSLALARFEDVVALAGQHRDIQMKLALERDVRLVRFEQGQHRILDGARRLAAAGANARAPLAGMDREPLDGRGLKRARQAESQGAGRRQGTRSHCPACAPSPWSKACLPLFRAPRLLRSARPGPRRKTMPAAATDSRDK